MVKTETANEIHAAADLLRAIGEALYGARWQNDLGRALGVNRRTIARWASGEYLIPATITPEIARLIEERIVRLVRLKDDFYHSCRGFQSTIAGFAKLRDKLPDVP